jgi:hypothetical protein
MHTDIHALSDFEPTIPKFERAKTDHALDRAATVIGLNNFRTAFSNVTLKLLVEYIFTYIRVNLVNFTHGFQLRAFSKSGVFELRLI